MKRNKGYAHSTAAARCLAIKYPFLEAEVVFAVEQVRRFVCLSVCVCLLLLIIAVSVAYESRHDVHLVAVGVLFDDAVSWGLAVVVSKYKNLVPVFGGVGDVQATLPPKAVRERKGRRRAIMHGDLRKGDDECTTPPFRGRVFLPPSSRQSQDSCTKYSHKTDAHS